MEFEGHITAEFKFNVIDVFKCHFKMYNIAVLSFRKDKIIVQTITKPYNPILINKAFLLPSYHHRQWKDTIMTVIMKKLTLW